MALDYFLLQLGTAVFAVTGVLAAARRKRRWASDSVPAWPW